MAPGIYPRADDLPPKRPTIIEKLYMASKVIFLSYHHDQLIFNVEKNRNGTAGEKSLEEAIKITADMLTEFKFQGRNKLFQYSVRKKLIQVMNKVLLTNKDCVPK